MVLSDNNEKTIKFLDVFESNIIIKGSAIVKSTANKSGCNSLGDSKIHIPANTTKVMNVIKSNNDKFV